jgi:K+-transporting ATPase KdpF subunit
VLAFHEGLRQALRISVASREPTVSISEGKGSMDYFIAGVASLGLFIYLIYALLRPEKF